VAPEDYFQTAFDILAERGPQALTTGHLCDRLKVTKGSFYYHFRNVEHFVEELADYRECLFGDIRSALAAEPDPVRRLSSAINLAVAMPHEVEVAIRAWARSNPVVGASQRRLDRDALSLVTATISGIVADPESGAIIGRQTVALLIGLQQLDTHLDSTRAIHTVASFLEKTCLLEATMTTTDDTPTLELVRAGAGTVDRRVARNADADVEIPEVDDHRK
jgi:AcrR family transcriptional regulator